MQVGKVLSIPTGPELTRETLHLSPLAFEKVFVGEGAGAPDFWVSSMAGVSMNGDSGSVDTGINDSGHLS